MTGPSVWNETSVNLQAEINRPLAPIQPSIATLGWFFQPKLRMASGFGVGLRSHSNERRVAASFVNPSNCSISPFFADLIRDIHCVASSPVELRNEKPILGSEYRLFSRTIAILEMGTFRDGIGTFSRFNSLSSAPFFLQNNGVRSNNHVAFGFTGDARPPNGSERAKIATSVPLVAAERPAIKPLKPSPTTPMRRIFGAEALGVMKAAKGRIL